MQADQKKKNLSDGAKSAFVYTLATLFSRGLAIITVPIFTRIMSTSQIGVVNIYNSWYALISVFTTLALTSGGYIVSLQEFHEKRDEYQSSVLSLTSIIALCIGAVYLVKPSFWDGLLGLPRPLTILMLVGLLVEPARDFWLARQRYEYKYKLAGVVIIFSALLASILSVAAVLYCNRESPDNVVVGRLYANYGVIYGIAFIIFLTTMVKGRTFYQKKFWKFSLSLSIPLVGYSIASQILNVSDRMMIDKMVGKSAVGIYSTIYTVSTLSLLVWSAIHASFVPYLFKNIEKKESNVKSISSVLIFLYANVAILITFFAPEIVNILAPKEYYEAIYIMPPVAAGVFLTSFANLYSDIPVYYKKTKYVMYPSIAAAVINVVLNFIFIRMYGYMAAAFTTMISYTVMAVLQWIWARKICRQNGLGNRAVFDDKKMLVIAVGTVLICLFGLFLYKNNILRYIAIGAEVIVLTASFIKYIRQTK